MNEGSTLNFGDVVAALEVNLQLYYQMGFDHMPERHRIGALRDAFALRYASIPGIEHKAEPNPAITQEVRLLCQGCLAQQRAYRGHKQRTLDGDETELLALIEDIYRAHVSTSQVIECIESDDDADLIYREGRLLDACVAMRNDDQRLQTLARLDRSDAKMPYESPDTVRQALAVSI